MFTLVSLNILAPSLTRVKEGYETFKKRLKKIKEVVTSKVDEQKIQILILSEVDEYVDDHYVYNIFQPIFPHHDFFYLPKPTSVHTEITTRHGTLILVLRSQLKCCGCLPVTLTDKSSMMISLESENERQIFNGQNQIFNILLLQDIKTGKRLIVAGVHLRAGETSERLRNLQIRELLKRIDDLSQFSETVLLAGDFNQDNLNLDNKGFLDVYECSSKRDEDMIPCARTQAFAPSLKSENAKDSKLHNTRLDYIFARNVPFKSKTLITYNVDEAKTYDFANVSDHFPIGVTFYN